MLVDPFAAQRIRQMREERGLSKEALANAIKAEAETAPWGHRGAVDAATIRKIERSGYVPGERVRFVLARFFGMVPHELWVPSQSQQADPHADTLRKAA